MAIACEILDIMEAGYTSETTFTAARRLVVNKTGIQS